MVLHRPASYPFRGIFYLIRHPSLWRHLFYGLLFMILTSIIASILLFMFAFPAQADSLSEFFSSWIAWIISFFLTLCEIAIVILISSSLFIAYYMDVIFDAVWRRETMTNRRGENKQNLSQRFSCIKSFAILITFRVVFLVLTSVLNIVPILGTMLFIYLNGYYYAWSLHCRYFDLIGLTFAQGKHFVEENRSDYTQFGIVAVLFEMIPFLNLITPITNVIASALWACDIEIFKEPSKHPRNYLLSSSPALIEQEQIEYRPVKYEKEQMCPPPYQEVTQNNIYPSAPPCEKE